MADFQPWVKYSQLTLERLSGIACLMRDVRDETVKLHDTTAGDNSWSLGCRIYARTCHGIRGAEKKHEWLTVLHEKAALRFTFAVGGVPLKFYRGDVGDAPGHSCLVSEAEAAARQLSLDLENIAYGERLLRLVVVALADGRTMNVTLVEVSKSGKAQDSFLIPFTSIPATIPLLPKGVDQGPPPFKVRTQASDKDAEKVREERNAG